MKKLVSLMLIVVFGVTLIACKTTTTSSTTQANTTTGTTVITTTSQTTTGTTVPADKIPPAFVGAVAGTLESTQHLKGFEVDLLEGVSARDNVPNTTVEITIINYGGYDKDVPGEYTLVIQAEDEAGNKTTVEKTVTVIDTLTRTLNAIVIGDKFTEYSLNDTEALTYTPSGTKFRSFDLVQVMTKDFFVTEYNEHKAEHTNNGSVPYFPNGIIVVVDTDFNVKLVRLAAGITVETNAAGELKTTELTWTNSIDQANGGGNFKGLVDELDTIIPNGGYLMFASNWGEQKGRTFLIQNFFYSAFQSGAVSVDQFDADYSQLAIELVEGYTEVIAVPDKLPAPVISINRHVLSFTAIENAKEYEVYVDGELKTTITSTTLPMVDLDLALTPEGDAGYDITVKAITKDMYQWSTSELSNTLVYKQIEILPLAAPVINVNGKVVSWELLAGAASYDVYVKFAGKSTKVGNTTEITFDLTQFDCLYAGYNNVYIIAVADDDHLDSPASNSVEVFLGEVKALTIGGYTVDVIETTAINYFTRRNTTYTADKTGFASAPFLFLITDINSIKDPNFGATATEAYSVVVLLSSEGKPKLINNIYGSQTWKIGEGWLNDGVYTNNTKQIDNMLNVITEGDMLLIGKNGNTLDVTKPDSTTTKLNSREFLANFYVNSHPAFPNDAAASTGWKAPMTQFLDPTNVTFTISTKA